MGDGRITIVPRRQEPQVGLLVNVGPDEPERKVCSYCDYNFVETHHKFIIGLAKLLIHKLALLSSLLALMMSRLMDLKLL